MRTPILNLLIFCIYQISYSQPLNYYFGNLHAHTAFSDGNKDSLSSGVSKPDASYTYAKFSSNFDFLGISEHNHYSALRNPGFKLPRYQMGLNMAAAVNQNNSFLALFGMEYGTSSNNNGHVIIYGFNQLIGWETAVPGMTGNNYNIYNAKSDYASLFKKVRNNPGSFAYLAHPYWTDFTLDGTDSSALAFMPYNQMFDSAIVGMPLRSGNAFSTFADYNDYAPGNYFAYYKKLLYLGYHLGIGYDHDNHYTNFGRSNGGRLVIIAPSLNQPSLVSAMQQMHFYGSDDANAKIEFNLNGNIMGSMLSGSFFPTLQVTHNDPDLEQADTIKIWKGFKNNGGSWAWILQTTVHSNLASYTDYSISAGTEYYYFAEIRQADGQWMVTSPIWYTPTILLSNAENDSDLKLKVFPNPARDKLTISFGDCGTYHISLTDLMGRILLSTQREEKDLTIDLSEFKRGVYILQVKTTNSQAFKKINVD